VDHAPLETALVLLLSGIAAVALARRVGMSAIVGLLAAGAVIGPHALGLVAEGEVLHVLAELGVAFLLFDVGLHLSLRAIAESRRHLVGLAPLQILGATTALGGLAWWAGLAPDTAVLVGATLALSSTAAVLQTLRERGEQGTPLGRAAVAVLVAQDLFVVGLLVVVPALGSDGAGLASALAGAVGRAALAAVATVVVGRVVLRRVLPWLTAVGGDEIFTASALLVVLATSWATAALGLSLPLGAFLAGLALSESRYAPLVQAETAPFRILLLALFFMTVGMSLRPEVFLADGTLVLAATVALVAVKAVTNALAARLTGLGPACSVRLGLNLGQGSEFAFVMLALLVSEGRLEARPAGVLSAAVGLSLALTPALAALARALSERIEAVPDAEARAAAPGDPRGVVLIGFDDVGEALARILIEEKIPYVAFTSDRDRALEGLARGFPVEMGDPTRPRALARVAAGRASAVAVLLADPELLVWVARTLRTIAPEVPVVAMAEDRQVRAELVAAGLHEVVPRDDAAATRLGVALLRVLGRSENEIGECLEAERAAREVSLGGELSRPAA